MDNVALLIDWENIKASSTNLLHSPPDVITLKKIGRKFGTVRLGRAYANWDDAWHGGDSGRLARQGIDPVFVPTRTLNGEIVKDLADFYLVCDAMELLYTHPEINCFVIASGDSALEAPLSKLSAHGRRTVRVAVKESLSRFRISSAAERVLYDDWVQWTKPSRGKIGGALAAFQEAVNRLLLEKRDPSLPAIKAKMREAEPQFEEENLGIGTFRHLAYLAEAQGLVAIDATRGEPAFAFAADGGEKVVGNTLPSGKTWIAFINALEEGTDYRRRGLVELVLQRRIARTDIDAHTLIEAARLSDVLWLKPNTFFVPERGRGVPGEQFMLNIHHPRVQVARSLRPKST